MQDERQALYETGYVLPTLADPNGGALEIGVAANAGGRIDDYDDYDVVDDPTMLDEADMFAARGVADDDGEVGVVVDTTHVDEAVTAAAFHGEEMTVEDLTEREEAAAKKVCVCVSVSVSVSVCLCVCVCVDETGLVVLAIPSLPFVTRYGNDRTFVMQAALERAYGDEADALQHVTLTPDRDVDQWFDLQQPPKARDKNGVEPVGRVRLLLTHDPVGVSTVDSIVEAANQHAASGATMEELEAYGGVGGAGTSGTGTGKDKKKKKQKKKKQKKGRVTKSRLETTEHYLKATVIAGTEIVSVDGGGKCDPLVRLEVGGKKLSTRKVKNSLDPVWNEVCLLSGVLGVGGGVGVLVRANLFVRTVFSALWLLVAGWPHHSLVFVFRAG